MKNILHISDIHVSEIPTRGMSEHALGDLLRALIKDLRNLPKIDTILITGDIANSGQPSEYQSFTRCFLTPLLTELGIDESRVLIAPGNHDSDRKAWKKSDQLARSGLIASPDSYLIEEIIKEKILDETCLWQSNFTNYRDSLDAGKKNRILSNKFFSAYEIDGIGVGCANSSWLANENDKEALFVGEWQIKEIIKALKLFEQKIILMHHPLDWLHSQDKKMLMNHIHTSGISCLFFGHMHEFYMTKETLFSDDSVLKLQAGRFDTGKQDYCGYSVVALHEQNVFESGDIFFRKLDPSRSEFRPWNERVENGKVSYSLTDALPFDPDRFCSRCDEMISEIEFDLLCNTGLPSHLQKKLSEIFVLPTLAIENTKGLATGTVDNKSLEPSLSTHYTSLEALSESTESFVILGGENSGKSTLAKRLALHYLHNQTAQNFDNIVFYLDLKGKVVKSSNRMSRELLDFYLKDSSEPTFKTKIEKKLDSSSAVVILDSIESLDAQSLKIVFEFISKSPGRFLVFGQLAVRQVLLPLASTGNDQNKFIFLNLKPLKRRHLKELVGKWKPLSNSAETNRVSASALKVVSSAGMANNPFVFTMLMSIRERKSSAYRTYMHEADLVENFIEIIMQKHVLPVGNVPQYKDILLFLGYIAWHMNKTSDYSISENELTQKSLDFNKIIIQDFNAGSYINPVLSSGIMRKGVGEKYIFSQICFFNYVLANWISRQHLDYQLLESQLDFIRFDKVVEYVSAIKSDTALLDYLAKKMEASWNNLKAANKLSDLESAEEEMSKCVGHDILDIVKKETLESSINKSHSNEQDHDDKLDQTAPLNDKPIVEVKSDFSPVNHITAFNETLSLYARAFRSAEHILDARITTEHFATIFQHYMNFIAFQVRAFDVDGRPQIVRIIKSLLDYKKIEDGRKGVIESQVDAFINFMIAGIPNWGVSMMSADFFNQRQRPRIEKHRERIESNLEKILLTYCLCELDDVKVLDELKSQVYEKRHESSSLIIKLVELIYLNFSLTEHEKEDLKKFLGKAIKDRKTNQLFRNYTSVATKMAQNKVVIATP